MFGVEWVPIVTGVAKLKAHEEG